MLNWRNKPRAKGAVVQAIEAVLDKGLPEAYDKDVYIAKCANIYRHVFDASYGDGESLYAAA